MREPPGPTSAQYGVFTRDQALAQGWTPSALRHAVRSGDLLNPRPGVYGLPPPDTPDRAVVAATRRAVAAALTHRGAVVSHASAAALLGLPVVLRAPRPCLTVPPGSRRRAAGAHLHRAVLPRDHLVSNGALLTTGWARSVVDTAREHGTEIALVMADAALRAGRLTRSQLEAMLGACAAWPYVGRARPLPALADPRSESPLESRSRWQILRAGLPPPTLQQPIHDGDGRFVARVDFYWDDYGMVGEADGEVKYRSPDVVRAEYGRERELRDLGLGVVRWTARELQPFTGVAGRLAAGFARSAAAPAPRRWQVGWAG